MAWCRIRELVWNWLDTASKLGIVRVRKDSRLQGGLVCGTSEVLYFILQVCEVDQLNCGTLFRFLPEFRLRFELCILMVVGSTFAQLACRRLGEEFTQHVWEAPEREGVVSLTDFAHGFSSEVELVAFLGGKGVVESHAAGPRRRWARLVVEEESRAHTESFVVLVRRAAAWRPAGTDGPLAHVHVSARTFRSKGVGCGVWGVCAALLWLAQVFPIHLDPSWFSHGRSRALSCNLDMAEAGIKWHP